MSGKFQKKPEVDLSAADAFIAGASDDEAPEPLPWMDMNPRVMRGFNLRLSEVELAKLQYIKEHRPGSIQQFIRRVLMTAIDQEVQGIIDGKK